MIGDHPPSGAIHQLHPADQHRAQEHSLWLSHPSRRKLRRPAAPLTDAPQLRPSSMPLGWRSCFVYRKEQAGAEACTHVTAARRGCSAGAADAQLAHTHQAQGDGPAFNVCPPD